MPSMFQNMLRKPTEQEQLAQRALQQAKLSAAAAAQKAAKAAEVAKAAEAKLPRVPPPKVPPAPAKLHEMLAPVGADAAKAARTTWNIFKWIPK